MRRRVVLASLAILVAFVAIVAFAVTRRGANATPVSEVVVRRGSFVTKLPETGVVQLPRVATVPAGVSGTLATIDVRAGDRVVAGQVLARILNDQLDANLRDAEATAAGSQGRASSVAASNAVLPEQNRSSIVQAQAAVVAARSQLTSAEQDVVAGSQSGLGYGGQTAQEQRLTADSALERAQSDLGEARRTYDANKYLYDNKGVSRDVLMQSKARLDQANIAQAQARSERGILGGTLSRQSQVLRDRVNSAKDALRQAQAALAAATATASQSKAGDLVAARADAQRANDDLAFARTQVSRLVVRAPFAGIVQSVAAQSADALRQIQPGDAIVAGQQLFTLAPGGRYVVRTKVDEQDVADVRVGLRAIVGGEDFGSRTLPGRVVAISPSAQRSDDPANTSRAVLTTIALDRTLPFVRDGMTADVDIVTHDVRDVLTIPIDAVRKDDGGSFVYRVRAGRTSRANVVLGERNDVSAVVRSGLQPGDIVVADKSVDLAAGAAVTPAPSPTASGGP